MSKNNNGSFLQVFGALTVGAMAGALAALLLSPKSGPEFREDLKYKAKDAMANLDDLKESLKNSWGGDDLEDIIYYDDEDEMIFSKDFGEILKEESQKSTVAAKLAVEDAKDKAEDLKETAQNKTKDVKETVKDVTDAL